MSDIFTRTWIRIVGVPKKPVSNPRTDALTAASAVPATASQSTTDFAEKDAIQLFSVDETATATAVRTSPHTRGSRGSHQDYAPYTDAAPPPASFSRNQLV